MFETTVKKNTKPQPFETKETDEASQPDSLAVASAETQTREMKVVFDVKPFFVLMHFFFLTLWKVFLKLVPLQIW